VVTIEIRDNVWKVYQQSWALMGIRGHKELVKMLEDDLFDKSKTVIEDAETHLIDDTPEAYFQREIGIIKEKLREKHNKLKTIDQFC
jgi:hypothetical protein